MIKHFYKRLNAWLDFNPPGSLTSKGWRLFKAEYKVKAPIRYWFKNTARRKFWLPIVWKYDGFVDFVRYRTVERYHVVKTGLPPSYTSIQEVMLHTNFNILKDFVEVEQAWSAHCWSDDKAPPKFWHKFVPHWVVSANFRNPAAGVKHLEWAAGLDDPTLPPVQQSVHQAVTARETLELYYWWVNKRPNRNSPDSASFDNQGLGSLASLDEDFDDAAPDFIKYMKEQDIKGEILKDWHDEDTDMLIRLIKIRQDLWT
jgi:hypothetical protein